MKLFTNASLPTSSAAFKRVNVLFEEKILKISTDDIVSEDITEVIDLKGCVLLPGAIDPHTHIISEKDSAKSIARVTKSAISGGWTTLAELSYFNPNPIFKLADMLQLGDLIQENSFVDMAVWGNVNMADYPYHAEAAQELWAKGSVGLALMNPSPNPAIPALTFTEIMDLFMEIYESDTAFAFQGFDHESSKHFSFTSQNSAIKKILRRMQENPIHIPRIASYPTIEFINTISKRSDISFSMCISDLMKLFSGINHGQMVDIEEYMDLFFELLRTNKIYMLSNSVEGTPPEGISAAFQGTTEKQLPYSYLWVLSEFWKKRKIPLGTVIKMTSENAAKRLGIYPAKGCLENGSDADFVIYDPQKNTLFKAADDSEHELEGSIESVYLRGRKAYTKGKAATAEGAFLTRRTNPKRRHNNTTWI